MYIYIYYIYIYSIHIYIYMYIEPSVQKPKRRNHRLHGPHDLLLHDLEVLHDLRICTICLRMCVYIYIYIHICIHIYIYRERDI